MIQNEKEKGKKGGKRNSFQYIHFWGEDGNGNAPCYNWNERTTRWKSRCETVRLKVQAGNSRREHAIPCTRLRFHRCYEYKNTFMRVIYLKRLTDVGFSSFFFFFSLLNKDFQKGIVRFVSCHGIFDPFVSLCSKKFREIRSSLRYLVF